MGLLTPHLQQWRNIGAPDFVCGWIQDGAPLLFRDRLPNKRFQHNRVFEPKAKQFVTNEIRRLCAEGFLRESLDKPHCILPLQVAPKKSGDFRLIMDCQHVSSFLQVPAFKQRGIHDVVDLIQPGDKLMTIDLKDGFFHIGVQFSHQRFLGLCWQGKFYVWTVLPFGLALSPYYF